MEDFAPTQKKMYYSIVTIETEKGYNLELTSLKFGGFCLFVCSHYGSLQGKLCSLKKIKSNLFFAYWNYNMGKILTPLYECL